MTWSGRRGAPLLLSVLVTLTACGAPPMTLTRRLHRERGSHVHVVESRFVCDIEAVRGRLDEAPAARTLAVDVAFRQASEQQLPPHMATYGASDANGDALTATLAMTPAVARKRWPEDYLPDAVERQAVGFRFQDARYFDGTVAAEVTFAGTVRPEAVAAVVVAPPASLAAAPWRGLEIPDGLAPALRSVRRHDFGRLVGVEGAAARDRCDPLAWLGPRDVVLSHEDVLLLLQPWRGLEMGRTVPDLEVDDCALLLRRVHRDGRTSYLRVALPVLREGDDLTLVRQQAVVAWSRREIWRARMHADAGPTLAWPSPGLHLATARVPYGYDDLQRASELPARILRMLVTPFTFAVDVLAWTNPALRWVVDQIAGETPPEQPDRQFTPTGGRR